MYNLNQLWTFVKVAESGSFNKAAEDHFISPNAVLKQMNNLENELGGIKLFTRSKRGNELTSAGRKLYHDAIYILEYCEESRRNIINAEYDKENTVRLCVTDATPIEAFERLWKELHIRYPHIAIELVPMAYGSESISKVWESFGKTIDISFGVVSETSLNDSRLGFELAKIPLYCQLSRTHRLAERELITLNDLDGEDILVIKGWSETADALIEHIASHNLNINVTEKSFYDANTYNRSANGNTIIIGIHDLKMRHPFLCRIPLEWEGYVSYGFVYSKSPGPAVEKFIAAVSDIINR